MLDCFPESGTKNVPKYECLHEARKTVQFSIASPIFVVFFAYLSSNRSTSFALKPFYDQSEIWVHFIPGWSSQNQWLSRLKLVLMETRLNCYQFKLRHM